MTGNNTSVHYLRTERLIKARQADSAKGKIEEMALAREILKPADLDEEASLATLAYLHYRYMTPFERTQEFALQYQKWYAIKQRETRGRVGRRTHKDHLAMWPNSYVTTLWRARQRADALGMPYDRYIISGMDRANKRGTSYIPTPNQLYEDAVVADIEKDRDRLRKDGRIELLPRDCNPNFFSENYVADPVQVAARDAITAEILSTGKSRRAAVLARYLRERRLISEADARQRLGNELVDAALDERLVNPVRMDQPIEQGAKPVPGCFGYHRSLPNTMCSVCPVVSTCIERGAVVETVLLKRHGTTDIHGSRTREQNRKRQQRKRDRARAGATMTLQKEKRVLRELGNPKLKEQRLKAKVRRDGKKSKKPEESLIPKNREDMPQPEPQG